MDCLRDTQRTARRRHKRLCFSCLLPILPGDTYAEASFAGDGRVWSTVEHAACRAEILSIVVDFGGIDYSKGELRREASGASPEWRRWYGARSAMPTILRRLAQLRCVREVRRRLAAEGVAQ